MRVIILSFTLVCTVATLTNAARTIKFVNRCGRDIWVSPLTNNQGPALAGGVVRLGNGRDYSYNIPDGGWGGRFWPKTGCNSNGQACEVGQSVPPCPPKGCQPPAETKVEFFFPPTGRSDNVWYDVSLVDGYSLAATITPNRQGGTCVTTNCAVSLDKCPTSENFVNDLRVRDASGRTVMCLAPCKKWNYPSPYGLGKDERIDPGLHLCCPTPPVSPQECRQGIVEKTKYVDLIHKSCPSAYSYSYDDEAGLHNCPNDTSFIVTFCG